MRDRGESEMFQLGCADRSGDEQRYVAKRSATVLRLPEITCRLHTPQQANSLNKLVNMTCVFQTARTDRNVLVPIRQSKRSIHTRPRFQSE